MTKATLSGGRLRNAALIIGFALSLAGCGGGGGTTVPSVGYVIDAPVGGMAYTCGLLTGTTGSDGSFHHDPGTACSFAVGNVTVGAISAVPSDGIVTPHDLAGVSRSDALNANAVAIAQFLQSLDDGTQSTRINIPASVVAELSNVVPTSILSSNLTPAEIQTQLSTLVSTATRGAKALVSAEVAAANVNTYLQATYPKLDLSAGVAPPVAGDSAIDVPKLAAVFPATLTATNTSAGFSATPDVDAVGYWEVLPATATSPNQWQVVSGLDAKNATAALSGHGKMAAATAASFTISGLDYSRSYTLYFVAANANATSKVTQVYSSSITTGGLPQPPVLSPSTISPIDSANGSATFSITSDVTGTGNWVVLSAGAAPSAAQILAGTDNANVAVSIKGSTQLTGGTATSISASGLAYSTSYTLYLAATNLSDTTKVSQVLSVAIQTGPPPPPKITAISSRVTPVGTTAVFNVTVDAGSTGYWVALNAADKSPSVAQVMAGKNASDSASALSGKQALAAATATNISMEKLTYSTIYKVYFVAATSASAASATAVQTIDVDETSAAPITNLSGTAAVGERLALATITVFDSKGSLVGTTTTDANGYYSLAVGSQFVPPFTVKAEGSAGDASVTLYSVASGAKVNVNQITNAISASLVSSGNPAELERGTTANSGTIANAESAYSVVLGDSIASLSASGSLISGTFDDKYDRLLDNVLVTVKPTGEVVIATSAGMKGDDLAAGATASGSYAFVSVAPGSLPAGSSLSALTQSQSLAASDLEFLRNKIQTCFASTSRGTVASPISDCQGLDSASGGETFLHNGYSWLDTAAACAATTSTPFCQGVFGYMLSQTKYDGLLFGKPKIIRPLNDTSWIVKFPITFNNSSDDVNYGTQNNLGEDVSNVYIVVKNYPQLASGSDPGWRFYGDQRTVGSYIEATAQRHTQVLTNKYRYETGLTISVNGNSLRYYGKGNQNAVYVKSVVVTGKGLPSGGVTLFNKGTEATVTGGSRKTWTNSCGGYPILSASAAELTSNALVTCGSMIRLSYSGDLVPNAGSPLFLTYWGGQNLTDAQIAELNPGEPYNFVITLSNGTVLNQVNRIHTQPLSSVGIQALNYPTFTTATVDALKTFTGQSASFTVAWDKITSSRPYNAAIYWSKGTYSTTKGISSASLAASSVAVPCTSTDACTTSSSWTDGLNGSSSDLGIVQIRTRQLDGFQIYSIIRTWGN